MDDLALGPCLHSEIDCPSSHIVVYSMMRTILFLAACVLLTAGALADDSKYQDQIGDTGVLVADSNGYAIRSFRAEDLFTPASTVKLITAYLCLQHWGEDHHFSTGFYLQESSATLWVEAGGDPFLVSEEIAFIAKTLRSRGLRRVNAIGLDVSLFSENLVVPGATTTDNPYDAVPTPLAANFNTVNLEKRGGRVLSAEAQTPVTAIAEEVGKSLAEGESKRVNLGRNSKTSEQYFAELLAEMLSAEGVEVGGNIVWGSRPAGELIYRHYNSRTLGEVILGMLKYSTNFIANQLLLTLVAENSGAQADFEQVQSYLQNTLKRHFDWQSFSLLEGAGLSSDNQLSASQLVEVVNRLVPWRHLLPKVADGVVAKTGTLTGVKSLAGLAMDDTGVWRSFAILMHGQVSREKPLEILHKMLN